MTSYYGYHMRPAASEDNQALLDMVSSAPMPGAVRLYLERSPDFFAVPGLMPGETSTDIAESVDHVVTGVQTQTVCQRSWKGQPVKVLHWGDLRVVASRQSAGAARALSVKGKERLLESGADMAMLEMLAGNEPVRRLARLMQEETEPRNEIVSAGFYNIWQMVPLRQLRPAPAAGIRRATEADLPALADLLREFYKDYFAVPNFTPEFLRTIFGRHPSFGVGDMWVLERHGRLVACSGLWDQSSFRRLVVDEVNNLPQKVLKALYPVLRFPLGTGAIPAPGQPFRSRHLCFVACERGQERALRDLIRTQLAATRRQQDGTHFLQIAFHEREPAAAALRGLFKLTTRTEIFYYLPVSRKAQRPWSNEELAGTMPWTEFALC